MFSGSPRKARTGAHVAGTGIEGVHYTDSSGGDVLRPIEAQIPRRHVPGKGHRRMEELDVHVQSHGGTFGDELAGYAAHIHEGIVGAGIGFVDLVHGYLGRIVEEVLQYIRGLVEAARP